MVATARTASLDSEAGQSGFATDSPIHSARNRVALSGAFSMAGVGVLFPFVSSYLGWLACFLTGSDTSSNLLFGNPQVAAADQLHLNPVLLAATNSSGAVTGKMISPQNIAVGVTTVGLVGQEGAALHSTFWHSILLAALLGLVACAQAYLFTWMVP